MTDSRPPAALEARGVYKSHQLGKVAVAALRGLDLTVRSGEFLVIAGPSGSGKTTLLNLLGCLDRPDQGSVLFEGRDLAALTPRDQTLLRRRRLGFVFQSFNLIPVLTARENVEYPLLIDGVRPAARRERAKATLAAVGLADRMMHRPDQLSGGERQRVALARALVHAPAVLLADEPTANLDSRTGGDIVDLLARLHEERATTLVLATHDPAIMARAPRRVDLSDGLVTRDSAADGGKA